MFLGKRISVVIPCHNEEEGVRAVIEQMPPVVDEILVVANPKVRCLEMPIYYGERVGESKLNLWRDGFGNLLQLFGLRLTLGRRRRAGATVTPLPAAEEEPVKVRASQS